MEDWIVSSWHFEGQKVPYLLCSSEEESQKWQDAEMRTYTKEEIEDIIREVSDELEIEIRQDRESSLKGHGYSKDFEWGFHSFRDEIKERFGLK